MDLWAFPRIFLERHSQTRLRLMSSNQMTANAISSALIHRVAAGLRDIASGRSSGTSAPMKIFRRVSPVLQRNSPRDRPHAESSTTAAVAYSLTPAAGAFLHDIAQSRPA